VIAAEAVKLARATRDATGALVGVGVSGFDAREVDAPPPALLLA